MRAAREIRVALVGAGYVSAYHARALQTLPHVRIIGVADPSIDRARTIAERFAIPAVFRSLSEMKAVRPDVVHVLTPPSSHAAIAIEALDMGCDVLVEKPMAPTVDECDRMIAAAVRAGRTLSVNHSAVHDPVVVRALELVRGGACGDVLSVDFHRSSDYPPYAGGPLPPPFRDGGYPLLDMGVHALSMMEAFLGTVNSVDVQYRSTGIDPNVFFDEWHGRIACANGLGSFYLSWSARPIRNEIFVHGTRGDLHIDCFLQTCSLRRALPGPKPIAAGVNALAGAAQTLWRVPRTIVRLASGSLRPSPGIHAGVVAFHDALAQGSPPPISAGAGRHAIAWLAPFCRKAANDRDVALHLDEPLAPRPVLVTGASGLLGRALLDRLIADGESVRVLVRRRAPSLEQMSGVQVVYGDLGDPVAVERAVAGVRRVYHVGAAMRGGGWPEFEGGTVRGTANIVRSCLAHRVERLVHVSSVTVLDYASLIAGAAVDESAPLEPHPERRGSYTRAKLLAERIVSDAVRTHGLAAVIVRPGQIVGRGYESAIPYGTIAVGRRWLVVGSGRLTLPLVHVDDVVNGLVASARRPGICGAVFHLVDPMPVVQRDYIDRCRERLAGLRVSYVPRTALLAAGALLDLAAAAVGRGLPLSRYRVRSINALRFDCSAAQRDLGWQPQPLTRTDPDADRGVSIGALTRDAV